MVDVVKGTVTALRKDGKGLQLDNGEWYSSYDAIHGISKGDSVGFEFVTKGRFKNIRGTVSKDASEAPVTPAHTGARGPNRGKFPIDEFDGQRSIIRQNAVTQAREVVIASTSETELRKMSDEELADRIIKLARRFEAYTTGDLDIQIANDMLAGRSAMKTTNVNELIDG